MDQMDPLSVMSFLLGLVFTWYIFYISIFIGGCFSDGAYEKSARVKFISALAVSSIASAAMGLTVYFLLSYARLPYANVLMIQCSAVFIGCWIVPGARLIKNAADVYSFFFSR